MPALARAWIISSRPDFANWSGKNPRFPTMTPIVIFFLSDINPSFRYEMRRLGLTTFRPRAFASRREINPEEQARHQQDCAPPHIRVQIKEDDFVDGRVHDFVDSSGKDERTNHSQAQSRKEPDRQ